MIDPYPQDEETMALIAQRDELKKIFNPPLSGNLLADLINKGEKFDDITEESKKTNPCMVLNRSFKVKNFLGSSEKTVLVSVIEKEGVKYTEFDVQELDPSGQLVNRIEVQYENTTRGEASSINVIVTPSGRLNSIAFNLRSDDKISYRDDENSYRPSALVHLKKVPGTLSLNGSTELDNLRTTNNDVMFILRKFPITNSTEAFSISLPRLVKSTIPNKVK